MPRRFYSRPIPFFQSVAMLILCGIFFLLPFSLRGARFAVQEMQNNVADWLPGDYPETIDLQAFRDFFVGDQFVVVSGPWCRDGNASFSLLQRKIFEESAQYEAELQAQKDWERIRAHRLGDKLGLLATGNYYEDWGLHQERWLQGHDNKWYWINRQGELYEWLGRNDIVDGLKRFAERIANGRNEPRGRLIDRFGGDPDDAQGIPNRFYNNPELLCARPFKSVTTGPDIIEKMAGKDGTLRIGGFSDESAAAFDAKVEAHQRLTGALFGPTPPSGFNWSFDSLIMTLNDDGLEKQLQTSDVFRKKFQAFVDYKIESEFGGDSSGLINANGSAQLRLWFELWENFELPVPSRQTCLVVTINDGFLGELDRIVGRPVMGRSRGRILELASGKCGLLASNVHLGGPPSDNVAIDEEGTSTLLRLASLSGLIGIILSYISFRSFRVTIMLFFVGGVSAISSLSYVWFGGHTLDAILMTMPSLIYVLAISASVHLVNYYRDACHEFGPARAVEIAVMKGWFPCAIASFTTAIGLASLCTSRLMPIYKFGLYSAIATIATLFFLYLYLPSSLYVWPPGYKKLRGNETDSKGAFFRLADRFWERVCAFVMRYNVQIIVASLVIIGVFGYGISRIETTVQLLKLFDKDAKVLQDYRWMEANLGKLVPMEIVVNVDKGSIQEQFRKVSPQEANSTGTVPEPVKQGEAVSRTREEILAFSLLERMEIGYRIRKELEALFGPDSTDIVAAGMSTDVFVPMQFVTSQLDSGSALDYRRVFNEQLLTKRQMMLEEDYLAVNDRTDREGVAGDGREMWRISLRLAALNDVDYGQFVNDLRYVVEPILKAYEVRGEVLAKVIDDQFLSGENTKKILLLGKNPVAATNPDESPDLQASRRASSEYTKGVDQTKLFSSVLVELLQNRGFSFGAKGGTYRWQDPESLLAKREKSVVLEKLPEALAEYDCVVMVNDSFLDPEFIREHSKNFVDCRQHLYSPVSDPSPFSYQATANQRWKDGEQLQVAATYTGIVPIVYKAQRALLRSLIESIILSFVLISLVMMLLLRDWRSRTTPYNLLNIRAGMISMLPNTFPIVLIFGAMGFLREKVDIGSMMTASVAMGIAVDDTIHFLTWYRNGLSEGLDRSGALRKAYGHCASAMTQTTLIAGFGLSVFALSTFAPTQRFGILMLMLLGAALIGDLLILPALLTSPLGKFFGKELPAEQRMALAKSKSAGVEEVADVDAPPTIPLERKRGTKRSDSSPEDRPKRMF